jgi:hypothetical protein
MRLLVGPNLELAARQLTVSVAATQTANANVYAGFIQPVVEPKIRLAEIQAERDRVAADIIRAEAQSGNWLAASWRPIVMLTFTAPIIARWLGFSAPGISEAEMHLIQINAASTGVA